MSTAFRWRHNGFWRRREAIRRCSRGSWKRIRDLRPGEPEGRARMGRKARRRGGKAKKRGLSREQVPGTHGGGPERDDGYSAVLPRVDAAALTAALDPVVAKVRPAGLRRWRELATLRRRARGEPRSAQPLDGGIRGDRLTISVSTSAELVPPRRPRPRRQCQGAVKDAAPDRRCRRTISFSQGANCRAQDRRRDHCHNGFKAAAVTIPKNAAFGRENPTSYPQPVAYRTHLKSRALNCQGDQKNACRFVCNGIAGIECRAV